MSGPKVLKVDFKLQRGSAADWTARNPILKLGEPGYESDTHKLKIGDGITAWVGLSYVAGSGGGGGGAVDSVFGRTGIVVAVSGDYTKAQVGLANVDNTSDAAKPISTATATALGLKADAAATTTALGLKADTSAVTSALATKADVTALATKADLVSGVVPYSQIPTIAFKGTWAGSTVYETGDIVLLSESVFGTQNGVAADIAPFTSTKLPVGTPTNTDSSDFDEYEFFTYLDVSEKIRMTGITFLKVATQTEVPITVRLWDRDISLTTPIALVRITPAFNFAGEVTAPVLWDLEPGKNYAVSFSVGFGSGFGYVYSPSFTFPVNSGAVTLRNSGFSNAEGTITSPNLGTMYWVGIQWQQVNTGWTRLSNLVPSLAAKGDPGAAGSNGSNGATGPAGETYPLAGYGFHSASVPIETARSDSTHGASWATRVWVPANKAINTIGVFISSVGAVGSGNNAFAVYDDSGNFVASTTPDNNLWTVQDWALKNLPSPIAAQGAGRFIYVVTSQNGSATDANIAYLNIGFGEKMFRGGITGRYRSFVISGMGTSFPSTIDVITGGSNFAYIPLVVLA